MTTLILAAYAAAAVYVAIWAFRYGVTYRAAEWWLSGGGYAVLALTALVVGAVWILFVPVAVVQGIHLLRQRRAVAAPAWSWLLGRLGARA